MVERIRQILQTRQLSPTQFADALGLARPIISHVLSGRNKPSLEVVQKIIAAFPELSLPWLLSGQEPMLAAASAPTAAVAPSAVSSAEPKRSKRPTVRDSAPIAASSTIPASPLPATELPPVVTPSAPVAAPVETPLSVPPAPEAAPAPNVAAAVTASNNAPQGATVPTQSPASVPDMLSAFAEPGKTIRRIVIFYHDGTFSAYQPEMIG